MSHIMIGPTGGLVVGDVLDVNKTHLERALQDYDAQLYLVWNPLKRRKEGSWELRRRPEMKTRVYQGSYQGVNFYKIAYVEYGVENHMHDFPILDYSILAWVKRNDIWKIANYEKGRSDQITQWINDYERTEAKVKQDQMDAQRADLNYNLAQEQSALRDYREAIMSGVNPALIARHWK